MSIVHEPCPMSTNPVKCNNIFGNTCYIELRNNNLGETDIGIMGRMNWRNLVLDSAQSGF